MRCEEFESRLNDLLDERRNPLDDAQIAEHCAVCSPCASLARGYDALLEGVAAWDRVEPSAALTCHVIEQWELAKAQSALAATVDWDSAELPALRPVGLQRIAPLAFRAGGFWSQRRDLTLASAALATAAMLLVMGVVGNWGADGSSQTDTGVSIAAAPVAPPAEQSLAQNKAKTVAPQTPTQLSFANIPLVEQVTETYRPLLEETDRTVRKSLGMPVNDGGPSLASDSASGSADPESPEPVWDAFLPDQMAPVTQTAVRSVVALLRVLPGVDQPLNQ